METVNISLPGGLAKRVDEIVEQEGYASRSEFFRALARFYLSTKQQDFTLLPFRKIPLKTVKGKLVKTGRYNDRFIESVMRGLARSSVYAQSKTSTSRP